jgi:hypothetical protein
VPDFLRIISRPLILGLSMACADNPPCSIDSTVSGFEPDCSASVLVRYDDESRFILPDAQGRGAMTAYLPAELEEQTYGGTTGQYLLVLLELEDTDTAANARTTTLELDDLTHSQANISISVELDSGRVTGTTSCEVEQR